jgi:hypothetical protein
MHKRFLLHVVAGSALLFGCALSATAQQSGGYLKAKVNPGRAGVFIDGKYVGSAANFRIARKYAVSAGAHEIKLVDPRYEDFATKVMIDAGKTTVIRESLKPSPLARPPFGRLRMETTDKFAAVYVNGKFMGHADEFSNAEQGLLLNPGEYVVKVVPVSGGPEREEKVKLEANQVVVITAR